MREIDRSNQFKRDYKRELKGRRGKTFPKIWPLAQSAGRRRGIGWAVQGPSLDGRMEGYRDCHVRPDLVLIYSKPDAKTLRLVRLSSHSELFNA
jgi:mRNA interferase YafQ